MTATLNAPAPAETGSAIVRAVEAAWATIRANHPEVPDVVVVTGSSTKKWGHFWANRWVSRSEEEASRKPELFVSGQLLAESGRRILQTVLHEAAHGLHNARGLQGTNVNGRHNKRVFLAHAEELGLKWPEGQAPSPTSGYSAVVVTDETAERYADTIAALDAARLAYLDDLKHIAAAGGSNGGAETGAGAGSSGGRGSRGGSRGGKRINAVCECEDADPFPISPGRLERKPIMCPDCGELYRPLETAA